MKKGRSRPPRQSTANWATQKAKEHRGRIVGTTGDRLLIAFVRVVDAVRCSTEVQQGMAGHNAAVPQPRRIEFRIGVNRSDIVVDGRVRRPCLLSPGHIR
jgi:class 3 adenylate cyclase